ncbi:hypothetical protein [Mucilaginibacter ginsenosidivorax]|uniref:Cell wall anchor protein n=1 Tax=Mucilaginibacter ginsenosidivorax TaxID=862126 RepID=A0A5B8W621_9SPHI|nr:hypothetical protein [Mucilaginibacter ginsenosidivorax]QEC79314.1 hypothetical protein FSB76_26435 [Mucilaginibacter ginsenosidivorax]
MKQFSLLVLAALFSAFSCYAQNTFPATGNVGIGTTSPASALDVNGAISLKGININESKSIPVASDGTYVVASGARIKGTYMLNFEAANRVQTVTIMANATQFDYNSSLSIFTNTSYNNAVVMTNFRFVFSADNSVVYLVFDIANRNGGTSVTALFNGTGAYTPNWGGTLPASPTTAGVYPLVINMGTVGINTTDTKGYKFAVNGSAIATSMTVKLYANWPDYVFKKDYQLPSLADVKTYINQNQHLPDMPSEEQVAKNGINLGEMNRLLLKKVEELTLYLIEKDKKEQEQEVRIEKLEKIINNKK